jgi:hypothetical protein
MIDAVVASNVRLAPCAEYTAFGNAAPWELDDIPHMRLRLKLLDAVSRHYMETCESGENRDGI